MQIWSIDRHDSRPSTWWWWFWLFFIKGGKNPRQLMILWSTKNCKQIKVNDLDIKLDHSLLSQTGNKFHGAVASWYYDGKQMHDDFILKECNLTLENNRVSTDAGTYTSTQNNTKFTTTIQNPNTSMKFVADQSLDEFGKTVALQDNYFKKFNFKIARLNHLSLTGQINNERIQGSAYFQKVQVNAPSIPWFWGISHFDSGAAATYFFPYLGTALFNKRDTCRLDTIKFPMNHLIRFFDGEKIHAFDKAKIKRIAETETPTWQISSGSKIKFNVETYAHACWRFEEKKYLNNILHYNEYPMRITEFKMGDLTLEDFGQNMGNAEHTWGRLL